MNNKQFYRPELDGLRGLAIILVVLYHAKLAGFTGGYIGVDIFFVLSGYLVTSLLHKEIIIADSISIESFFQRRIKRLLPVFFCVVLVTIVLGVVFLVPIAGEQQALAKSAIASSLFLSNLYYFFNTGGYFDDPTELQPLLHTWSLAVEAQFYLVWPFFIGFTYLISRKNTNAFSRILTISLVTLIIFSLVLSLYWTSNNTSMAFFMMPSRIWEFCVGAILISLPNRKINPSLGSFISCLSLFLILFISAFYDDKIRYPGYYAILPVAATAAIILLSEKRQKKNIANQILSSKFLVTIGLLSYSWYLWHWPLLSIYRIHNLGESSIVENLLILTFSLLLSFLTYHVIENPLRIKKNILTSNLKNTYIFGSCMILIMLLFAVSLGAWSKYALLLPQNSSISQTLAKMKKVKLPSCLPASMQSKSQNPAKLDSCKFPENSVNTSSLIWGDSHAAHLVPGVSKSAKKNLDSTLVRYSPQCPPIQDFFPSQLAKKKDDSCKNFNHEVLDEVTQKNYLSLKNIILSARWNAYLNSSNQVQFEKGLEKTILNLLQKNLKVILFAPVPNFDYSAPACVARKRIQDCSISEADAEAKRKNVMDIFYKIKFQFPEILIIDPFSSVCREILCSPIQNETLLYSDSHHLSEQGSLMMSNLFDSVLFYSDKSRLNSGINKPESIN